MSKNTNLNKAKVAKDDEFYTRYEDIEKEVSQYAEQLRGKVIYCPCDWDASYPKTVCYDSEKQIDKNIQEKANEIKCNFVRYLIDHAKQFGIKRVYASGYNPMLDKGVKFQDADYSDVDIVITNPPFSLFREFVSVMIKNNLQFLIIGGKNAITYKEIFPLLLDDKIRLGFNHKKGSMYFITPKGERQSVACFWYTNLNVRSKNAINFKERYDPQKYPKFDNYEAINVDRTANIPVDYHGIMGVPITYLLYHDPNIFKIIGEFNHGSDGDFDLAKPQLNNKVLFKKIAIQRCGMVV